MQALKLVHPGKLPAGQTTGIEIDIRLQGSLLSAYFKVRSSVPPVTHPSLPLGSSQWGLWDWDVAEIFLSTSGDESGLPYYEFQVSPLGQYFELEILEPRARVNREFRCEGLEVAAQARPGGWDAQIAIPLDRLGWAGDPAMLRGNAFACLGPKDARTYWSRYLEPQAKPDFHLPREFRRFFG